MTGFLLDTNVPSELTRSQPNPHFMQWLHSVGNDRLHLSVITLGEIRKGLTMLPDGKRRQQLEQWLVAELEPWFEGRILPVDRRVAALWGTLEGQRQLQGRPLSMADGLIAATSLEHGLTLVTRNVRDYDGLGIELLNPWEGD
jgi:predicted nucleic acid-binding protein